MISPEYKQAIRLVYTPLTLIVLVVWIVDVVNYDQFWQCSTCREGEDPSPVPWLVYASMWSNWVAMGTFFAWAYFMDNNNNNKNTSTTTTTTTEEDADDQYDYKVVSRGVTIGNALFPLALPMVTSVSFSYVYYMITNPVEAITDTDACYTMVRSAVPKDLPGAHIYLYFGVLSDIVIHYLNSILLLALYMNGEFTFHSAIPWSTLFTTGLGMIIVAVQNGGITVYCGGNAWFSVGGIIVSNFIFHIIFVLGAWGKCCCCRNWSCVAVRHGLVEQQQQQQLKEQPRPVVMDIEHDGEIVAHVKSTSLVVGGVSILDVEA